MGLVDLNIWQIHLLYPDMKTVVKITTSIARRKHLLVQLLQQDILMKWPGFKNK